MVSTLPWEGYVRRKRPRAAVYCRYDDREILLDWIDEHAHFSGMHSIEAPLHREPIREAWYLNGIKVELTRGMYLVVEDGHPRAYTAIEMAELFDVTEEIE